MFKRFKQYVIIGWMITILIVAGYAYVHSIGINRTYGSNVSVGWGLVKTPDGTDSVWAHATGTNGLADSLMTLFATDSTTALKVIGAGARVWGGMTFGPIAGNRLLVDDTIRVTKRLAFSGSASELYLPANAITNTMTATIDSGWITDASLGWRLLTQPLKDSIQAIRGSGATFLWRVNGEGTYTTDSMSAAGVAPIYLTHTALTGHDSLSVGLKIGHGLGLGTNNDSVAVKFGPGLGLASESLAVKDGWGLTLKTGDSLTIDSTQLKTDLLNPNFINDGAGEINATNDFNFTSAVKITNLVADSCDAFWDMSSVKWTSQAFILPLFSIYDGVDDNMGIYYPMSVDSGDTRLNYCAKHTNTSGSADLVDTVSFSGTIAYVPDTAVAIDSLTFNFRASSATVGVASIKPLLSRKRGDLSPELANYAGSATATIGANAWKHVAITSGLGKVSSNEELFVTFVVTLDDGQNLYHDTPRVWVKGHN
jgi:hypothetical protein